MKKLIVIGMAVIMLFAAIFGGITIFNNQQPTSDNYVGFTFDGGETKMIEENIIEENIIEENVIYETYEDVYNAMLGFDLF